MDQQVSPAVVVIVLILIVAILVGLYFLVVERKEPAGEDGDVPLDPGSLEEPTDAGAEPASADEDQGETGADAAADQAGDDQGEGGTETDSGTQTDAESDAGDGASQ